VSERYELIRREEGNCPVASMCKLVGVSKSGYYDWLGRPDSATKVRRRKLTLMVESEFNASDMTYGYRRVTAALHRKGVTVSADTVRSIMREKELRAAQPRRKVRTTVPADDIDTRPDLVGRDFTARTPGLKWVGDITYIRTWVGFVYLATVLDCCTKKVIGYAMADNMRTDLVCGRHRVWPCAAAPTRRTSRSSTPTGAASTPHSNSPGTRGTTRSAPP